MLQVGDSLPRAAQAEEDEQLRAAMAEDGDTDQWPSTDPEEFVPDKVVQCVNGFLLPPRLVSA